MSRYQFHELFVLQVSGRADNDVSRNETLCIKFPYCSRREALYRFLGSQDRPPQRVVLPEILGEDFVDEVIGIVLIHFDFF